MGKITKLIFLQKAVESVGFMFVSIQGQNIIPANIEAHKKFKKFCLSVNKSFENSISEIAKNIFRNLKWREKEKRQKLK